MNPPAVAPRPPRTRNRSGMFLRMIWRAALVRRGRALTALAAVAVAAAVTTALLTLYVDAQAKLRSEFRNYGANIVLVAREGSSLPGNTAQQIAAAAGPGTVAVPFGYAIAYSDAATPVVVAGTDLERVRRLNATWWSLRPVNAAAPAPAAVPVLPAIVGTRAAAALSRGAAPFPLTFEGKSVIIAPTAILQTGGPEDSRIYVDLGAFTAWTGVPASTWEVAVSGSTEEVHAVVARLAAALPQADVRPVRQIVEAQARVLGKTQAALLASTLLVVITAALCVLATLITWVLDRRRDFAVMKALGASEALLKGFFAAESALLGGLGSLAGFGLGLVAALVIGRVNFNAAVAPRFSVLPVVLAGGIAIALMASLVPISFLRGIQPATLLKGE